MYSDAVTMELHDNGPGIEPETLHKIFEPFYTTKEPGEGTGMGLSICHGIVQQHGGEMWATSKKGTGQSSAGQEPRHPIKSYFNGQDLIVDDEPAIRYIVAKGLLNDFDAVDQAANGEVALDMIRGSNYDCILLDLKMPGINGQEVYERVARYDRRITDRIFVMTGDTASPETASFLSRVGNTVIHKPFTLDGLRKNLRDGLLTGSSTPK